jgi:hypothetical protein
MILGLQEGEKMTTAEFAECAVCAVCAMCAVCAVCAVCRVQWSLPHQLPTPSHDQS